MRFITMLRFALPKLIVKRGLDLELVNVDFWKSLPKKFTTKAQYEIKKAKEQEVSKKKYRARDIATP